MNTKLTKTIVKSVVIDNCTDSHKDSVFLTIVSTLGCPDYYEVFESTSIGAFCFKFADFCDAKSKYVEIVNSLL